MTTELDPKFLKNFSTDYEYEELTDEQKEVHDALFAVEEEIEVDVEGPVQPAEEENELDNIISQARGAEPLKLAEDRPQKQTRFADIAEKEPEGEEEWEDDGEEECEVEEIDVDEADVDDEDRDFIGFKPNQQPGTRSSPSEKEPVFTAEDFPPLSVLDSLNNQDVDVLDASADPVAPDDDSEEDKALEQRILDEEAFEREMREVMQNEYQDAHAGPDQKTLTQKEFDLIIDDHLKTIGPKKGILKHGKKSQAPEARVETVASKAGGQATFYFGGAKPNGKVSKSKKEVRAGVEKALQPRHDYPEEFKAKMREMAATREERIRGVNLEPSEEDDDEEDDQGDLEDQAEDGLPQAMHVKKTPAELQRPKREAKVETVTAKGGGQIVFYFGGAKPNGKVSKAKKELQTGVEKALEPSQDYPEEFKAKMREMAATREERIRGVQLEASNEEDEAGDGEEEEEDSDGEEGDEEEDEDLDINPEVDDEIDIKMKRMRLNQKLPLCERIERDNNLLPDEINGLKVFKKTLLPEIPYAEDVAAQQCNAEEEEIDFSKPPTVFDSKSIRDPLVEYEYKPKVLSKEQALAGATLVKEYKSAKKRVAKKPKAKIPADGSVPSEQQDEAASESDAEDAESGLPIVRRKDETPEERKARKELVKKAKEERKLKKKKFKEKYEQMKKGVIGQMNAHTGTTQGVSMYRIG